MYALYNASTFSGRDVRALISDGQQTMSVSLEFEADGKRWRVTRSTSRESYPPSTHKLNCLSDSEEPPLEGASAVTFALRSWSASTTRASPPLCCYRRAASRRC